MPFDRDHWFILDGRTPRAVSAEEFALWRVGRRGENHHLNVVALYEQEGLSISTVFLGINHQWKDDGPPLIFETMIFGGEHDGYQHRTSTWEEAEQAHRLAMILLGIQTEPAPNPPYPPRRTRLERIK